MASAYENNDKFGLPGRYMGQTQSIWDEYIKLGAEYKPINLGQGFPDFAPPDHITTALQEISKGKNLNLHQYTRGCGHPRLIKALSRLYSQLTGRNVDAETEIMVTVGGYGALFSSIMGHVDHGDEVIIIEPFFDCYEPMVRTAGGVPVFVPLRPKTTAEPSYAADWVLDPTELENAFNSKTKAIIINSPNNPLGKVYTEDELLEIARLCEKWNVMCISDEVYEWLVYKNSKHIRICTLPGMWERTITIGSAGKTFSVTGWKIGWTYGPPKLMNNLHIVQQNSIYTCSTPLQEALAVGFEIEIDRLDKDTCGFTSLIPTLEAKRNYMAKFLADLGLNPVIPDGGYFIIADCSSLASKIDLSSEKDKYLDMRFTKWLTKNVGVLAIPCSVFYGEEHKTIAQHLIRLCFIKNDEKLKSAVEMLKKCTANL